MQKRTGGAEAEPRRLSLGAGRDAERAIIVKVYADEARARKHGALQRTRRRMLAEHNLAVPYWTVRNICTGKSDAARAPGRKSENRFASVPLAGRVARMPAFDSPALMEGRTRYPSQVLGAINEPVLKSGMHTSKLGGRVLKGKWKGYPLYVLTLEERATCPRACEHWRSCFGNVMHLARRMPAGSELEARLVLDVEALSREHSGGFVVRLHNLGDFYSTGYVRLWAWMLDRFPPLHCFGYSRRWEWSDPIARELLPLVRDRWDRFAIRFSNAPVDECATVSIEHPYQKPLDTVLCPAQLGQTESCSTCAFCWQSKKRVAFIQH